ncbi:HD domain-containing protein [bacterium]|nr:HD domain-containing protein [bacterium]
MHEIIQQLEKTVEKMFHFESSGHDINHLKRVLNLALTIQKKEGGDDLVIGVAAFLHDIHRVMQKEMGRFVSPKDSLPKIKELLNTVELSEDQKEKILHCVEFHEEYNFSEQGKTVDDIETLIVQDADNLDAIGAIGVGRTFAYSGANQIPMWIPDIPFNRESYKEGEDDPSTVHHFYSKLFKLKDNMNTATAKKMAESRHKYMETFLEEFFAEWEGKK